MRDGAKAGILAVFAAALCSAALAQSASFASVSVLSGPHKGEYGFTPRQACLITTFGDRPTGISLVLSSETSSLSIDMPDINEKHASELQVVLVIADKGAEGKGPSSTTYEFDTRPETTLEPFKRAERGKKGMKGKAKTTLVEKGQSVMVSFSGETAEGVKMEGTLACYKVGE